MFIRAAVVAIFIACSSGYVLGQVDPPKLDPAPSSGQQTVLIQEGVAQHDKGNFDAAIKLYEEALAENPNNVEALYEMGFSYWAKKDYRKSLEAAYKGAQYKSEMLGAFYMQIGNNLDILGEPKKSVEALKSGIKLLPRMAMLHLNLAVTYRNLGKVDDAKKFLKQAITLDPNHAGSHSVLSGIWYEGKYRTPALLAACRSLVLDPRSERATGALRIVKQVLGAGVTTGSADPNQINIFMDTGAKKDEGDFGAIDFALSLTKAASMTEKNKGKTPMQLLVGQFETFFAIMSEQSDKADRNKFTWQFYVPYFNELKEKKHVEAFVYHIMQSDRKEETLEWLAANKTRVGDFLAWSKFYKWPQSDETERREGFGAKDGPDGSK
jgi:tetratricopeptide (TPR) repeat protein